MRLMGECVWEWRAGLLMWRQMSFSFFFLSSSLKSTEKLSLQRPPLGKNNNMVAGVPARGRGGGGHLKIPGLKGSLWNQIWSLKEPCFEGSLSHHYRFFEELFKDMVPWFERFLVEPDMVLLWHHSEEPFWVPHGPSIVPCVFFRCCCLSFPGQPPKRDV